ncbi:MAG: 16S rRNA (uracil(1498)-N(3))-methyltransferase [Proteobacteria bacterium]|nr:16S rRNA (uracil(1498)-N(3))-methyltransferase [Pseudomonadota bacterium]
MASPPWFYYPFKELEQSGLELSGKEVTHIIGARRLRIGDELVLMNGQGKMAHCTLEEADKKTRTVKLKVSLIAEVESPRNEIILACALPKGDRLSTMLDMACQLGMTQFQPLVFDHSVSRWNDKLAKRCERILIEASKQSKSARVPEIRPICTYPELLAENSGGQALILLADQFGRSVSAYEDELEKADTAYVLVGPEGGLSETEIKLAHQHRVAMLRLACAILRIETAAVAAVTALQGALTSP